MIDDDFPAAATGRPLWLITLADLALLLVGFFVLMQATRLDKQALAQGLRDGFGVTRVAAAAPPPPMPLAAAGILDFATGSATIPAGTEALVAWAREAARDPRVTLTVTGSTDGTPGDVDAATRSAAILAADRARAVAAAIATAIPTRITVTTSPVAGHRAAMVTLAMTGDASTADRNSR